MTTLQRGQDVTFQVSYTCLAADWTNATVTFDPTPLDPNYGYYRLLTRNGFTPPGTVPSATISGSGAAGWKVALGNLIPGATGAFTVGFTHQKGEIAVVAWRDSEKSSNPTSFFPDGFRSS